MMKFLHKTGLLFWMLFSAAAHAASLPLDADGIAGYGQYRQAGNHRAFAIAPGGAWSWRGDMETSDQALQAALEDCRERARRQCLAYALDDRIVFKPQDWARAWRPYSTAAQAKRAATGLKPGQRFPDLIWREAGDRERKLSDLRGNVVLLHFWGSWCPPCQREMPDLKKLHASMKSSPNMHFVFIPVREPASKSRAWLRQRGIGLPVVDATDAARQSAFKLADGGEIGDRDLARAFPTSYIVDRNGIVLFTHIGPVADWSSLAPLLRDAAQARE